MTETDAQIRERHMTNADAVARALTVLEDNRGSRTEASWRAVEMDEGTRLNIRCQHNGCERFARLCRTWQSPAMAAPAFWYFCLEHSNVR